MLVGVYLFARAVLFLVDVLLFLRCEFSAVGLAIRGDLMIDILLVRLGLGYFRRGQLPASDAVGNSSCKRPGSTSPGVSW